MVERAAVLLANLATFYVLGSLLRPRKSETERLFHRFAQSYQEAGLRGQELPVMAYHFGNGYVLTAHLIGASQLWAEQPMIIERIR